VYSNGGSVLTAKKINYWEKTLLSVPLTLPQIAHIQYTDLGSNSVSRVRSPRICSVSCCLPRT